MLFFKKAKDRTVVFDFVSAWLFVGAKPDNSAFVCMEASLDVAATSVVGIFQASEEDGVGAAAAAADERLRLAPREAAGGVYGVHNVPGCAFGTLMLRSAAWSAPRKFPKPLPKKASAAIRAAMRGALGRACRVGARSSTKAESECAQGRLVGSQKVPQRVLSPNAAARKRAESHRGYTSPA